MFPLFDKSSLRCLNTEDLCYDPTFYNFERYLTFFIRGKRMTLLPRGGFTEAMFHSRAGFSLLVFNSAGLSGALLSRKTSFHEPEGKKENTYVCPCRLEKRKDILSYNYLPQCNDELSLT